MNCPTRVPDKSGKLGHYQNPGPLDNDLTSNSQVSNSGLENMVYTQTSKSGSSILGKDGQESSPLGLLGDEEPDESSPLTGRDSDDSIKVLSSDVNSSSGVVGMSGRQSSSEISSTEQMPGRVFINKDYHWSCLTGGPGGFKDCCWKVMHSSKIAIVKYSKFIGPGIMVSVAYMDPGNYSTAVSAGALYKYKLLFIILVSNLFAVFLQTLCAKLGSVTGMDLAQNCRKHLPRWLNITIYVFAEIAIIATDLAEVVGTAISLNILFAIPLSVGVILTVIDVLLVLMAYRPNGPMNIVRYFEYLVSFLVFLVVVCFAIELSNIGPVDSGEIFEGFLPSLALTETQGVYLSCGILGATVMPHSLYLGSGLVQPRLKEYDAKNGYYSPDVSEEDLSYRPSIHAIKYAMNYSIAELVVSLFTVAIFVNSAILIVAGATLSQSPDAVDADLFSIYNMLQDYLGQAAATVFALALLFSGQSAGIVCTLAGQMVSEGFLQWSFRPWIRRLITRALAVVPCLFVSLFVGRKGLADVLNASQVVLSLLLPLVSAPLLFFTANKTIMKVAVTPKRNSDSDNSLSSGTYTTLDGSGTSVDSLNFEDRLRFKDMSNSTLTNSIAIFIFVVVSSLNLYLIISMAFGADVHL